MVFVEDISLVIIRDFGCIPFHTHSTSLLSS
ncbi:MAG: hypothetical protein ACJAZK_003045, partial [Psychroserpens sp.]